jgi:hypothetical protein
VSRHSSCGPFWVELRPHDAWGRGPADYGHIAYVTTDGGHTAVAYHRPGSDEIIRPARPDDTTATEEAA